MKTRIKLNHEVEAYLTSNMRPHTYSQIAALFNTSARGIGSCMRAIGKRNIQITNFVVKK